MLEFFLKEYNILEYFRNEMFNMKCRLKIYSFTYILIEGGFKRWNEIFPNVNIYNLFISDLRFLYKLEYIIAKFRLYPIYRMMKNNLKKILL